MTRSADVPHKTGLLLALRTIRGGHVIVSGSDAFSDGGRPFPGVLAPFLHELFAHGQVRLEEQGREPPRAVLTTAGEELLRRTRGRNRPPLIERLLAVLDEARDEGVRGGRRRSTT